MASWARRSAGRKHPSAPHFNCPPGRALVLAGVRCLARREYRAIAGRTGVAEGRHESRAVPSCFWSLADAEHRSPSRRGEERR